MRDFGSLVSILGCLVFGSVSVWGDSPSEFQGKHSRIELYSYGKTWYLKLAPEKGWHLYWKNPGDSGSSLRIEDFSNDPWTYPVPERISFGTIINFGYEKEILLRTDLLADVWASQSKKSWEFQWLVCKEECIPERANLSPSPITEDSKAFRSIQTLESSLVYPEIAPDSWDLKFTKQQDRFLIILEADTNPSLDLEFFPYNSEQVSTDLPMIRSLGSGTWEIEAKVSDYLGDIPQVLEGILVSGDQAWEVKISRSDFHFFWQAILFAFLGGILLNLMPCVFPVLALKSLSVVQASGVSRRERMKDSTFYGLGILSFFALLFLIFYFISKAGTNLGWGFQLQNTGFVFFLISVFFILSLQMFGWIQFSVGFSGRFARFSESGSPLGSFFSGGLAVLVATPCTAPFMGSALAYALGQSSVLGLAVFFSLGLGMAIPVILIQNSAWIARAIPRPGPWMETFKELLAFPLALTSVWLYWVFLSLTDRNNGGLALVILVAVVFLIWLRKKFTIGWVQISLSWIAILSLLLGSVWFGQAGSSASGSQELGKNSLSIFEGKSTQTESLFPRDEFGFAHTLAYSPQNLKASLDTEYPVFLYFTADWCVTCKYNESTVFSKSGVQDSLSRSKVIVLKGDWTDEDPEITTALQKFGRNGVPLYVYYSPKSRKNPRILPQILTEVDFLKSLEL
jgi:thiol:disulfide interchange protein DsbD